MGAGVETLIREILSEPDHLVLKLGRALVGDPLGGFGARGDGVVAPGAVPGHELGDPALGDPMRPGHLPAAALLQNDRVDQKAGEVQATPPWLGVSTMARDMLDQPCPLSAELRHHALRSVMS